MYDSTPERAIMQVGMHWHACVVPPCTCRMHSNSHFASFETGQQQRSLLSRCCLQEQAMQPILPCWPPSPCLATPRPITQHEGQIKALADSSACVPCQVLQWTQERGVAQRLAWRVAEVLAQELQALQEPRAGTRDWLAALASAHVPCACISSLDRCGLAWGLDSLRGWCAVCVQDPPAFGGRGSETLLHAGPGRLMASLCIIPTGAACLPFSAVHTRTLTAAWQCQRCSDCCWHARW